MADQLVEHLDMEALVFLWLAALYWIVRMDRQQQWLNLQHLLCQQLACRV